MDEYEVKVVSVTLKNDDEMTEKVNERMKDDGGGWQVVAASPVIRGGLTAGHTIVLQRKVEDPDL